MCKGKEEFLVSLLEDVENLSNRTSYGDFRKLEVDVRSYEAVGRLLNMKNSNDSYNYTRLPLHFKEMCDRIRGKDLGMLLVVDKLRLTRDIREIFGEG